MRSEAITPILERARRPDGSLAPFEVLLRSTSIQANATDTQVIDTMPYPLAGGGRETAFGTLRLRKSVMARPAMPMENSSYLRNSCLRDLH